MHGINRPSILAHNHRDLSGDAALDDDVDADSDSNGVGGVEICILCDQVSAKPKEYASWITGGAAKRNPQW